MDAYNPDTGILSQRHKDVVRELAVARLLVVVRIAAALNAETSEPACDADAGSLDNKSASQKLQRVEATNRARKRRQISNP